MLFLDTFNDREKALYEALEELADECGDSITKPKSLGLILIRLGFNYEDKWKLITQSHVLAEEYDLTHIEEEGNIFAFFRKYFSSTVPEFAELSDISIFSIIKALSITYNANLYAVSSVMESMITYELDLE